MDVKPFPQEDYDIALASLDGGFAVEVGSKKGEDLVRTHAAIFQEAAPDLERRRDEQRARVLDAVQENLVKHEIPDRTHLTGAVGKKFEHELWADEAGACVECGACNTVCPTCHCFFLFDQADKTHMARLRLWDSCLVKDFARVAGGANPRPQLWMRLRNRFEKKFDFFPKTAGVYACTGCGRCISGCPAKIDIRRVLKRLVSDA
jgi:ferredoxin